MKQKISFRIILSKTSGNIAEQVELFAILNLGLVHSLASGAMTASEAIKRFYHTDNCLYVHNHFRNREADAIMSHGIQLPDLFACLPVEEAQREFFQELEKIRILGLKLLGKKKSSGTAQPLKSWWSGLGRGSGPPSLRSSGCI